MHLLLECCDCSTVTLDSPDRLITMLERMAHCCNTNIIKAASHKFQPYGVTAFLLLSESHISIHTWPENKFAAIDVFSCVPFDSDAVTAVAKDVLDCKHVTVRIVDRGPK
jgi:S-adenosylmethionine decarboxylase